MIRRGEEERQGGSQKGEKGGEALIVRRKGRGSTCREGKEEKLTN